MRSRQEEGEVVPYLGQALDDVFAEGDVFEPLRPVESDPPLRRCLRDYAQSVGHCLTHKPALPKDCDACLRGKTRAVRKLAGRSKRAPRAFGDIVTMDHVYMRDVYGRTGLGGSTDILTVLDLATAFKYCDPVESKDALEVLRSLQFFRGDQPIERIYSDNFRSFQKACYHLGIMWERSQPGVHETNGRIERCNGDILAGIRTLLVQGGLPSGFWPLAGPCFCHLDNITLVDGTSPWFKRHGDHFAGLSVPFGCGVHFIPAVTKYARSKADPRLQWGVFVGYRLAPGGKWNGEYLVYDLDDFRNMDFRFDADPTDFPLHPHVTKVVRLDPAGPVFPLRSSYDKANLTLDGRCGASPAGG